MALLRSETFDEAIWSSVLYEYPDFPESFSPGDVVLDVGCHTGAVSMLAAQRGATVMGYEASLENFVLAVRNLKDFESVRLCQRAVWRSDRVPGSPLWFVPHVDRENTGGGSVMFANQDDHWRARPTEVPPSDSRRPRLAAQVVEAVGLDQILVELGRVRMMKLDVEGAEFPILLTAGRLDLVEFVVGEYHEFSAAAMELVAAEAVVGTERYTRDLLRHRLEKAGFSVELIRREHDRGYFKAIRRR